MKVRGTLGSATSFERAGSIFQFGQFVDGRGPDKTVEASRCDEKAFLSTVITEFELAEYFLNRIAHALGRAAACADEVGHFIQRQALPIAGQRPRKFENRRRLFQSHD